MISPLNLHKAPYSSLLFPLSRAGTAHAKGEKTPRAHRRDRDFSMLIVCTLSPGPLLPALVPSHFRRGEYIISDGDCQSVVNRYFITDTKSNGNAVIARPGERGKSGGEYAILSATTLTGKSVKNLVNDEVCFTNSFVINQRALRNASSQA